MVLVDHYDVGGQKGKPISKAEAALTSLFYNNEHVYPFDAYAALLMQAFWMLDTTANRRSAANHVCILMENIKITTPDWAVIKGTVCSTYRLDLQGAIEYISRKVSELYTAVHHANRRGTRHCFISATDSSPSNRACTFEGLEQSIGVSTFYGVNVTNVHRRFTNQEMSMLGPVGQAYVYQECNCGQGQVSGGRGWGGGRGHASTGGRGCEIACQRIHWEKQRGPTTSRHRNRPGDGCN